MVQQIILPVHWSTDNDRTMGINRGMGKTTDMGKFIDQ